MLLVTAYHSADGRNGKETITDLTKENQFSFQQMDILLRDSTAPVEILRYHHVKLLGVSNKTLHQVRCDLCFRRLPIVIS